MKRKNLILKLNHYKNLINTWDNFDLSQKDTSEIRSQINKDRAFVEEILNRLGCSKRFDWHPPALVGGTSMIGANPFDSFFNPPGNLNVSEIITDSIDQAIGIIENLDSLTVFDEVIEKTNEKKIPNLQKIFIVHGHDNELKETVARFIESIDLKPIILNEQANTGLTIIEKFEKNSDVQFAVVLMTPDDVGNSKLLKENLNYRARQNVVLELGYFLAKLGRENVCALIKGSIERPSDYDGVVYLNVDPSNGWKLLLSKELKEAGLKFDSNKIF